jgi:dephospho-CoA kinase
VVHQLLTTPEMRDLLVQRWGKDVAPAGEIDRTRVAEIVFADPAELRWLESELHPRVGARIADWAGEHGDAVRVAEVPLLFEAGMEGAFDATICVVADEDTRRERAKSEGKRLLGGREDRQLSQEEKADRADYVIRNDGSPEDLERSLAELLDRLRDGGDGN